MKRLANKLYKLQLKGELKGGPWVLSNSRFKSPDDYVQFIRQEMTKHARRMHWYNLTKRTTKKESVSRLFYTNGRKRLHNWLDNLEAGLINYL